MDTSKKKYICINCTHPIDELYTKYSVSVTRIANCVRKTKIKSISILYLRKWLRIWNTIVDFFREILGEMPWNSRQIHRIRAHRGGYWLGSIVKTNLPACVIQHWFQSKHMFHWKIEFMISITICTELRKRFPSQLAPEFNWFAFFFL